MTEFLDGASFEEIAERHPGWNAQSLRALCNSLGSPIGLGRGKRCIVVLLDARTRRSISSIAGPAGRTNKELVETLIRYAFAGEGRIARRILGKAALPRKQRIPKNVE